MYKEYFNYPYESSIVTQSESFNYKNTSVIINECLQKTTGLALEIGGPTETGYELLKGVSFPNKLVISNAYPENGDYLTMDITEKIPFDDKSLGCVVSSCLPVVDLLNPIRDAREIKVVVRELDLLAERIKSGDYAALNELINTNISPRISLINESSRLLEDGGLLIVKSLLNSELKIIDHLGFEEIVSVNHDLTDQNGMWNQKEYGFRLNRSKHLRYFGCIAAKRCVSSVE